MKQFIQNNKKQLIISFGIALVLTIICMILGMNHSAFKQTVYRRIIVPELYKGFPFVWRSIYATRKLAFIADVLIYFIPFSAISFGFLKTPTT